MDGDKNPSTQAPSPVRGAQDVDRSDLERRPADYDAPEYYSKDQKPRVGTPQPRRDEAGD